MSSDKIKILLDVLLWFDKIVDFFDAKIITIGHVDKLSIGSRKFSSVIQWLDF